MILYLFIVIPLIVSAISSHIKTDSVGCTIINQKYWDFIEWFYGRSSYIFITLMCETKRECFTGTYQDQDLFLKEISKKSNHAITYKILSHDHEEVSTSYANMFSWQGGLFEYRENQTRHEPHRQKRHILNYGDPVPIRKDEPNLSAFIITEKISTIDKYLVGSARRPFRFPRRLYIISIMSNKEPKFNETSEKVLKKLWLDYGISNAILMTPCNGSSELIGTYIPFDKHIYGNKTKWGSVKWIQLNDVDFHDLSMFRKLNDLQGFPLQVSFFPRYPTAIKANELPQPFLRTYFMNIINESGNYSGLDGIVLGNMARILNFLPLINTPTGSDFGYKLSNGTFIGSIGDVLYRRTYASFNGRFMTDYGTDEIEYMFPVFFDKLCVIAPKALRIPEWMAIFKCFDVTVWVLILIVNSICGCVWYILKESTVKRLQLAKNERAKVKTSDKFSIVFIEMWVVMLSGPTTQSPTRFRERIFLTGCFLANVIIAGSFQGSLTTSYSTTSYYKDIETLDELDKSGLPVGTSSGSLRNLFGTDHSDNDGKPAIRSLAKKFQLFNTKEPIIEKAAYRRDICSIERLTDIAIIIATQYELPDGSVLLHVIKDCPRAYYMSYIVKKGWPLLPAFSNKIRQLFESGLLDQWYESVENAIISHKRFHRRSKPITIQAFTLVDMQTAFYILCFGLLGCCIVFIIELYCSHRSKRKAKRDTIKIKEKNIKTKVNNIIRNGVTFRYHY